jgi:hypothetical protein
MSHRNFLDPVNDGSLAGSCISAPFTSIKFLSLGVLDIALFSRTFWEPKARELIHHIVLSESKNLKITWVLPDVFFTLSTSGSKTTG